MSPLTKRAFLKLVAQPQRKLKERYVYVGSYVCGTGNFCVLVENCKIKADSLTGLTMEIYIIASLETIISYFDTLI